MSTVIIVNNTAELNAAMATLAAGTGGTIRLTAGSDPYKILFKTDAGPDEPPITITSDDPANMAVVEQIDIRFRENVTIDSVVIDSTQAQRDGWINDIEVNLTENVTIQNSILTSDATGRFTNLEGGKAAESLGTVRDSDGFIFANNTVSGYFQGLTVLDSDNITISDNDISRMQGDGLRLAGIKGLLISDNHFHDFYGSLNSLNHDDMIQLWGRNAGQLTENVVIRGNILDAGSGAGTQGIFGRNEDFNGSSYYKNILIEDNIVHNGSYNGISMSDADGLIIRNNTVLWNKDAITQQTLTSDPVSYVPNIRSDNSLNVQITGNIAVSINAPTGTDVSNNAIFTYGSKTADNYIGKHLVNGLVGAGGDLRDLMLTPDSTWAGLFGADLTQSHNITGGLMAVMAVQAKVGHSDTFTFSAALSQDATGIVDDTDVDFIWTFADGTTQTGVTVTKTFANLGDNDVTLTVQSDAGASDTITRTVEVVDPTLVEINFDTGIADVSWRNAIVTSYDPTPEASPTGVTGHGFHLDGSSRVSISRDNYHIFNKDSFSMGLAMKLDEAGDTGAFLRLHQGFYAKIDTDGSVRFSVTTSDGSFGVSSAPGVITDTEWHKIWATYDSSAQELKIYIDGVLSGTTTATGVTEVRQSWGLDLGETWGTSVTAVIDDFAFTENVLTSAEVATDHSDMLTSLANATTNTGSGPIDTTGLRIAQKKPPIQGAAAQGTAPVAPAEDEDGSVEDADAFVFASTTTASSTQGQAAAETAPAVSSPAAAPAVAPGLDDFGIDLDGGDIGAQGLSAPAPASQMDFDFA